MSLNPVTWKCSVCPSSHSVFEANEKGGRCDIVLADQNFPAVLPSSENRCLSIIRLEHGSLDDLIALFVNITRQVTVPPRYYDSVWFPHQLVQGGPAELRLRLHQW